MFDKIFDELPELFKSIPKKYMLIAVVAAIALKYVIDRINEAGIKKV